MKIAYGASPRQILMEPALIYAKGPPKVLHPGQHTQGPTSRDTNHTNQTRYSKLFLILG